jgi:hypothetical protein
MVGFAEVLTWAALVLAIGGGLFILGALVLLSVKERRDLAGQGYGARIRPRRPDSGESPPARFIYEVRPRDRALAVRVGRKGRRVA